MADPQRRLSSAFDDMLAQTKERFDALYRGPSGPAGNAGAPVMSRFAPTPAAKLPSGPSGVRIDPQSQPARWLNEHFGGDWHCDITERQHDGDEAIVLCRLTFGKDNAVRTQFGRAKISGSPVVAASEGVRFKVGGPGSEQDVRDAFRRAAEAALMNCIDLI